MAVDYYNILKVTQTTNEEEIRKAYKKLAVRWHPDKHPSTTKLIAEAKFKQISEAYDALSDPTKRQIYDLYGETGLRYDVSSPSAAHANAVAAKGFKKAEEIQNKLGCSLEDLYKGTKRNMLVSRIVPDVNGKPCTVEEVLSIDIKPGWKRGTKITFPDKGNQDPGLLPGDLIFVIDEKPHPTFKRDGNDLLVTQKISLVEALTGKKLNLTTLDGRNLNLEVSDVIKPGHEIVIPGEGMPLSKEPTKKGNMRIKFDVKFPSRLSSDQKVDIKRVLSRRS